MLCTQRQIRPRGRFGYLPSFLSKKAVAFFCLSVASVVLLLPRADALAVAFTDDFDSYTVGDLATQGSWFYPSGAGNAGGPTVSGTRFRTSGKSITLNTNALRYVMPFAIASTTDVYLSYYVYRDTTGGSDPVFLPTIGTSNGGSSFELNLCSSGLIRSSGACSGLSSSDTIPVGSWTLIELRLTDLGPYYEYSLSIAGKDQSSFTATTTQQNIIILSRGTTNGSNPMRVYVDDLAVYTDNDVPDSPFETGFNSTMNTRFTDLDISGTSTLSITAEYFLDGNEINETVSSRNPTYVKFWYADRASTSTDFSKIYETIPVVDGSASVSTEISSLADGTYDLLVGFSNFGCNTGLSDCPFPDSYVYTSFSVASGILSATGTNEFYDRTDPIDGSVYRECGITDISGCLINAGLFLLAPDESSLDGFSESFEALQTRFPFVYAFQVSDYMDTLFTATSSDAGITASTTLGSITFINKAKLEAIPYSSTFRTIIGYAMWLTFLWGAYRIILRVFNPVTT